MHTHWHNCGRMAWRYQGHTQSSMPLPQLLWHHNNRRWTHPKGRRSHHSTIGKGEGTTSYTQRMHGYHKVPVLHARHCIYWPGINEDIRMNGWSMPNMPMSTSTGTKTITSNQSPAPECPWQHIGTDFFTFNGFEYLVIIDYYTKIPFIRKISPPQCNASKTISVLKELFSEYRIPETIRSDNGPQFASHQFALSLLRSGTLITPPAPLGIQRVMAKLKLLSKLQKVSSPMPNIEGRTPTLPCWHTGAHPLMPIFVCTSWNALPESNTNYCASKDQAQGPPSCSWL